MLWRPFAGMIGPGTGGREVTKLGGRFCAEQSLHFGSGRRREFLKRDLTNHLMGQIAPRLPAVRRGQSTHEEESQNNAQYSSLHVSPPEMLWVAKSTEIQRLVLCDSVHDNHVVGNTSVPLGSVAKLIVTVCYPH